MADTCDSKCAWVTKTCPIGLDHKIEGLKDLIKERKETNDKDVKLAKLEVDRDLSAITLSLDAIVTKLAPLATVLAGREGGRKWSESLLIIALSVILSSLVTFLLGHR